MFTKLTDFGYHRTGKQAVGFYLAYFLFLLVVGAVIGGFLAMILPEEMLGGGLRVGTAVAVVGSVTLSYLVLQKKKLTGKFGFLLLALFGGLAAIVGGGVLGLIIPAYLTTQGKSSSHKVIRSSSHKVTKRT